MLIANTTRAPLSVLILLINLPFVALGYRQIGRPFAIKSALAIVGLSIALEVIPYPDVTPDLLLTSVFGGFFVGAGIGLAMRGGGVLDGTEVAALLISRSNPLLKAGDVILQLNVIIFGAAAFFLSIESTLYPIITYFAASKTVDFISHGIGQHTALLIVSRHHVAIQTMIAANGWGLTVFRLIPLRSSVSVTTPIFSVFRVRSCLTGPPVRLIFCHPKKRYFLLTKRKSNNF